jgi:hypothetical protein
VITLHFSALSETINTNHISSYSTKSHNRHPLPAFPILPRTNMAEPSNRTPWYAAYPEPRNKDPDSISRADLLQRFQAGQKPGVDFLLIDLRRSDHEVYIHTLETLFYDLFRQTLFAPRGWVVQGSLSSFSRSKMQIVLFTDGKRSGWDDSRVVESSGSKFV